MLTTALTLAACGCGVQSLEQQILVDFFAAARLHDSSALSRVADANVDFNPRTQGVVQDFAVSGVEVTSAEPAREVRQVTLQAQVRRPNGELVPTTFVATLERRDHSWLVTALRPGVDVSPQ